MSSLQTLAALSLSVAALLAAPLGASAATPPKVDDSAVHHPATGASAANPAMDARMKAMREMHDKMASAKTPAERQALMAEHMKAMQDGMQMMNGMSGMGGMGARAGAMGKPADMAQRQQMMEGRMDMMQTMMDMMMQRMPAAEATGK